MKTGRPTRPQGSVRPAEARWGNVHEQSGLALQAFFFPLTCACYDSRPVSEQTSATAMVTLERRAAAAGAAAHGDTRDRREGLRLRHVATRTTAAREMWSPHRNPSEGSAGGGD